MIMANALHFNQEQFETELAKSGVLVVDFWASWCMPCKMLAPVIDRLAAEYEGKATVGKVDVDEEAALAARYNVQSIPYVAIFRAGKLLDSLVGVRPYEAFTAELDKVLVTV